MFQLNLSQLVISGNVHKFIENSATTKSMCMLSFNVVLEMCMGMGFPFSWHSHGNPTWMGTQICQKWEWEWEEYTWRWEWEWLLFHVYQKFPSVDSMRMLATDSRRFWVDILKLGLLSCCTFRGASCHEIPKFPEISKLSWNWVFAFWKIIIV